MYVGFFFLFFANVFAQLGPGNGAWTVSRPEAHGLSEDALDAAEAATNSGINGRTCYMVIKNGEIVYEKYRGSGGVNVRRAAWSCTKSFCGSLFGIAIEQGWGSVTDKIADRNSGTRQCNRDAQFRHALTMTGTSSNINNPRFSYDTLGTNCLDSISDTIGQNNPERLGATNWKNRFWHNILGLESMTWGDLGLGCGFGAQTTCRDMARVAQLYLNDGQWRGAGQVMSEEYTKDSRTWIFPTSGTNYGYTVWRQGTDSVDNDVSRMDGMYTQCAIMSKVHEATIISMGQNTGSGGCTTAWTASRNAIVSKDVRHLYNFTVSDEQLAIEKAMVAEEEKFNHEEIMTTGKYAMAHPDQFSEEELGAFKEYLEKSE